jgi:HEAT repeat protein
VIANPVHVKALVALIGDDDKPIRKYAAEALMKLTDTETVKLVQGELNKIIDNRKAESPDAVYNAVAVLGTWLRILPSDSQNERIVIEKNLRDLKILLENDSWWKNTSALIDEMLRLSSGTRKPQRT